jgi:DNA-binding GntR family transcriptional regulator
MSVMRRHALADRAYDRLRSAIVTLRLAPGAPLAELGLCKRLGVSRTPVRTALLRLQQDGLVVPTARSSAGRMAVAPLTASDMRELFLMVGALDAVAARLAAGLDRERRLAVAADAAAINERLSRLPGTGAEDIRAVQELDSRFHACYESAAAGPRLQAKLRALHAQRERYVRVYTEVLIHGHLVQDSLDEHAAIVSAIGDGDPEAAHRAALSNYRNALQRYDRVVALGGERGNWA